MSKKGKNITEAFQFMHTFYSEVAQLFIKLDDLMEKEGWISARGNTTTTDVSKDLLKPKKWLPEESFRLYENKDIPNMRKGIIVSYVHENIEEPLLIIGAITYNNVGEAEDLDILKIWFWDKKQKILNKAYFEFEYENEELPNKIKKNVLCAMDLVDITSEEDIKNKVLKKMMEL